ncbi:MAG: hypothetical protein EG828_11485 [Deltaproteobacteria bacterium]|nr:hypothetical protein [Deltaproteobacteria bacterium]
MNLIKGLEILVEDWHNLHEDGGANQSVERVMERLGTGNRDPLPAGLKPAAIAERLLDDIRHIPGAKENVEKFMAQFQTPEELLEEIDLDCLVSDLTMTEDDET